MKLSFMYEDNVRQWVVHNCPSYEGPEYIPRTVTFGKLICALLAKRKTEPMRKLFSFMRYSGSGYKYILKEIARRLDVPYESIEEEYQDM